MKERLGKLLLKMKFSKAPFLMPENDKLSPLKVHVKWWHSHTHTYFCQLVGYWCANLLVGTAIFLICKWFLIWFFVLCCIKFLTTSETLDNVMMYVFRSCGDRLVATFLFLYPYMTLATCGVHMFTLYLWGPCVLKLYLFGPCVFKPYLWECVFIRPYTCALIHVYNVFIYVIIANNHNYIVDIPPYIV